MLTPADIKNRTIKTTMGGYNKKDTDEFIASILESFEELNNENKKLKEKLSSLSDGIQYYKNLEDNLQKALVLAEKTSDETKKAAKAEAANIVSLAKTEASDIVSKAKLEADELIKNTKSDIDKNVVETQHKAAILNERLSRLTTSFESYKREIKALVENQLEFIESEDYSPETPVFDIPDVISEATNKNEGKNDSKSDKPIDNEPVESEPVESEPVESEPVESEAKNPVLFKWTSVSDDDVQTPVADDEAEASDDDNSDSISKNQQAEILNEASAADESDVEEVNNKTEIEKTKETKESESDAIISDDDIIVENIMTTPTLEGVDGADISSTVFPASKPDKAVSYLSEIDDSKKDSNDNENDNPFTFIDLD